MRTALIRSAKLALVSIIFSAGSVLAQAPGVCSSLPSHAELRAALRAAKAASNGGFATEMWGTIVNRSGIICAIVYTGNEVADQWPGSRLISAAKANTANAFSLPKLSVSTANLFSAVQPGGSLYGLSNGNPLDSSAAYRGFAANFGTEKDPLVGDRIGGTITFGGGLALYNDKHELVGALGVSGDSSCADHHIAWRTRSELKLDYVPGGVSGDKERPDTIVYDIDKASGKSSSGWGHAACSGEVAKIAKALPPVKK